MQPSLPVSLRRNDQALGPLIATHVHAEAERATEELRRLEVVDGASPTAESLQEKRSWLKQLSGGLETMAELAAVSLPLVEQLVSLLRGYLTQENADVRMLAVRGFSKLFLNTAITTTHFRTTLDAFLSRFQDAKTTIRIELIRHAQSDLSSNLKAEDRWELYRPLLEARLRHGRKCAPLDDRCRVRSLRCGGQRHVTDDRRWASLCRQASPSPSA